MTAKKKNNSTDKSQTKKTTIKSGEKTSTSKKNAVSMAELLSKHSFFSPKKGMEIDAVIVSATKKQLVFDIGWKSYAVLGQLESQDLATYLPFLKPGDKVKVKVVVEESKDGYPVVSMRKFFEKGKWDILEEAQKNEAIIEVVCGEYGKGGVFVEFMGIRGVIPKIQLYKDYINSPETLNGQKIKVKVLEVDRTKNRL